MNRFRLYNPPLIVEQHTRYKWSGCNTKLCNHGFKFVKFFDSIHNVNYNK